MSGTVHRSPDWWSFARGSAIGPGHGRSGFCLEFQPDPPSPGAGPAHQPLGPDQPALLTPEGTHLRHDAVPLGLLQPLFMTLLSQHFLQIHVNPSVLDPVVALAGHRSGRRSCVGIWADRPNPRLGARPRPWPARGWHPLTPL